jgi:hydrogenase-4 component B
MGLLTVLLAIILLSIGLILACGTRWKPAITAISVVLVGFFSSWLALGPLMGEIFELPGNLAVPREGILIRMDPLAAWFVLIVNITLASGIIYGMKPLRAYLQESRKLSLHCVSFVLVQASLLGICIFQNSLAFLVSWEFMTLSTFLLITFDPAQKSSGRAGLNYFIQSHISLFFIALALGWVGMHTHSLDLWRIAQFSASQGSTKIFLLFLLFFIGFGIKAGFIPFHSWQPEAHSVSMPHVSAIMSGIIIKIGIFGLLRILLLLRGGYQAIGYFILIISLVTGIYGVMQAIAQHELKKMLSYHSIENIGIIGIGMGLGCLGLSRGNNLLTSLGFGGALLHVLNHSLFKSVLFYGAGNIYAGAGTLEPDRLGGLIRKLPQTAFIFLIASLAICGLPPFNGFVSEFIIYRGLYKGLALGGGGWKWYLGLSIAGLACIGGLAFFCFSKAFGMIFLGKPRENLLPEPKEAGVAQLSVMYLATLLMVGIGILPAFFAQFLEEPVKQYTRIGKFPFSATGMMREATLSQIGRLSLLFIGITGLLLFVRKIIQYRKPQALGPVWGCGYPAANPRMQYTADSFAGSYLEMAGPVLGIRLKENKVEGIFPKGDPVAKSGKTAREESRENSRGIYKLLQFAQELRFRSFILYLMIGGFLFCTILWIFQFLNGFM